MDYLRFVPEHLRYVKRQHTSLPQHLCSTLYNVRPQLPQAIVLPVQLYCFGGRPPHVYKCTDQIAEGCS